MANPQGRNNRGPRPDEYECRMRIGGEETVETVQAQTPALATRMVQAMYPAAVVLRVTKHWDPIGKCYNCGAILFDNDGHRKRRGLPTCFDCANDFIREV